MMDLSRETLQADYDAGRRDFRSLDLSDTDLLGIRLVDADLSGCNFSGARLVLA
ncbi:MAG: pentapeptide repeat-containing protein, partial [Moorea sp. SIO3C2]|nr:pentapeptide repeat-containing protein [Moorena sp. SIO3C2]